MELYATGFNAWRQLEFDSPSNDAGEPDDFESFRSVLKQKDSVEKLYASLSYTLVNASSGGGSNSDSGSQIRCAGFGGELSEAPSIKTRLLSSSAAVAGNGSIASTYYLNPYSIRRVTNSGVMAVYCEERRLISQYTSLSLAEQGCGAQASYPAPDGIIQLVAYETGFAVLSARGDVLTWGDERYSACLGREVTDASPAQRPSIVSELQDLPTGKITKIAAGGYLLLALTEGNDLYVWGGHPGRPALVEGISQSPTPVVIEEHDIIDCAVGESHLIVLADGGHVYVIGDNTNGQLGLPVKKAESWTEVVIPAAAGQSVVAVEAGPRSSFVLAKHKRS